MAFSSEQDDDEVMSEINMTPLVDVMLVLLIIFMLTVPVLTQSVDIELPQTTGKVSEQQPKAITISIKAEGQLFWNEEAIDKQALQTRLANAAAQSPQPQIQINGDRQASYDHVIQVMAGAQRAGLTQLGFITEVSQ
ncbi:MAG TPA: biopolymer transporter ExbD [Candidatus Tenderia electrophaga]|uniref:Biopolymer transporter ExbD n=1 Tax=Candidatus Tenderia electrophaga TaxID=1748243 RepID=A0A832J8V0_9GAMM|nr:biopolymer transporter ExbD [Candidatus Tenderia electrophaga]